MIDAREFVDCASGLGYRWYAGVPCSFLTPLINCIPGDQQLTYVASPNEGDAGAAAAGVRPERMTTLITGASGFVGSAVLRQLLEGGHEVRALLRKNSDRRNLAGLPVEIVIGDLNDRASLHAATAGCNALFHVAADYRLWTAHTDELYRTNVDGTRNIMLAALDAGIERIVYTSSVATLGCRADGLPADEATPVALSDMVGDYKRSKFCAEAEVLRLVREQQLPAIIVNPSTPVGPRDIKPTPTGRMVQAAVRGRMPAYVDTGLNIVHVDDVARGHWLAYRHGQIGRRYILGGEDRTLQSILAEIARFMQRSPPRIRIPRHAVYPVAWLAEIGARLFRTGEPMVTRDSLRMSEKLMFFSSARAIRELGYRYRPATDALRDAVDWFLDTVNHGGNAPPGRR